MSEFVERFEGLMIVNNFNQKTLAKNLSISPTCINHYLQGKHIPTVEHLIKIADYFNCSTDFLLGREEEDVSLKFKVCPPFAEQLTKLKEHFKCSSYFIYHDTGISKSSYYGWKNGTRVPNLDNVVRLAKLFDCRVDFVLGRSD